MAVIQKSYGFENNRMGEGRRSKAEEGSEGGQAGAETQGRAHREAKGRGRERERERSTARERSRRGQASRTGKRRQNKNKDARSGRG